MALRRRFQSRPRTGTPADLLVVGLGNPGSTYEGSRHNVGRDVVGVLVDRHGGRLRATKEQALADELRIDGQRVAVAMPQTYMNESGRAVRQLVRRHGIDDLEKLVIVHDELDLPLGRLKIKLGGGLAGHNGLRSIHQHLHSSDFARIRIGVGKPPRKEAGASHVLSRVSRREREDLDHVVVVAADAVEAIVSDGIEQAMNRFNQADP